MLENIGLYHGIRKDNGEWVEGAYLKYTSITMGDSGKEIVERHLIVPDELFNQKELKWQTQGNRRRCNEVVGWRRSSTNQLYG